MTESQLLLREFEAMPKPSSCRLIDFEEAEVRPGIVSGTYILIVRGTKPYLNMEVNLTPLVYIRQPEYWGIEVIGCLPGGIGLAAPTAPYIASLPLNGITGTQGIEVIGATRSEKISIPPAATGDFAAFLGELLDSIPKVRGSGRDANPEDQLNQYVLPTASQLASWRAVFQSLLAGAWGKAHIQARMISSTYNVVQFLDIPTGRTYYVLMEDVPGQIPAPASHPSGSVTITEPPADPTTRRGWGTYVFNAQPQRALSLSAPHLFDDAETEVEAVEAFLALGARTLLIAGTDRDQNTAEAPCAHPEGRRFREADVSHTAESVFQMAFEEIYSSDASTWHIQFHGNASTQRGCENVDVFLSNGVEAAPDPNHPLRKLAANIETASGGVLSVDVYDARADCILRGTDNMQMRFASGRPHASICAQDNDPMGPSRFIHVEQSREARRARDPATPGRKNRGMVVDGIKMTTFPSTFP
jgi:hypothetical protein